MLSPSMPPVVLFVLAAAVPLPAASYAADAPLADATAKDVCIKACNEGLRKCVAPVVANAC